MSLFSKPKAVLWPKTSVVDLYLDRSDNNVFSIEANLWQPLPPEKIQSLSLLLAQNKVEEATVLIPDDVVFTKSFIYDSEITSIDKAEVIGLAESFVHIKIDPDFIDYKLIPSSGKTVILSHIFDRAKIEALRINLSQLKLKFSFESVSESIAKIISLKYSQEYFLLFPIAPSEFTLLLASKDSVYLTSALKGTSLEVQKIINYSNLYFSSPTTKFYVPHDQVLEINATTNLDKTPYNPAQIAEEFKKPANLPLPVLGLMVSPSATPAIINAPVNTSLPPQPTMEKNKSILPFIGVFIVTAIVASSIIYFVLNKNNSATIENPVSDNNTPTETVAPPTDTPTPTVVIADVSKKIKLQVLNSTDINGQAAVLKEQLTKLGFTSVTVGNSKEKATTNQIQLKASQASASAYFQSNLPAFANATVTTDLKAASTYDAVFIIGTDLSTGAAPDTAAPVADEPTVKTTPTAKVTVKVTPKVTPKTTATPTN